MSSWQAVFIEPAKTVFSQIGQFISGVVLVLIIFLVGWFVSKLIRTLVVKGLKVIKLDELASRIELDELLTKGGIKYSLSGLIGVICYWLVLLVTAVVALNAVNLPIAADLLNRVVQYIPNIVAAIFILILGMFVATMLKNIVQTAANNAGVAQANLLSKIVEVAIMLFAIAIALEQLNIGAKIIELTITVLLGSLGLALALAFGLGCKDIAAKVVAELLDSIKNKK
jgi:small-conductance mechanosensitive channel